jgi:hypothetical protein
LNETLRIALLWVLLPICAYNFVLFSPWFFHMLTPESVRKNPICAVWTVGFTTAMAFIVADGSDWRKALAALAVLGIAVWWHFSGYFFLIQVKLDPIARRVFSDKQGMVDEMQRELFGEPKKMTQKSRPSRRKSPARIEP